MKQNYINGTLPTIEVRHTGTAALFPH